MAPKKSEKDLFEQLKSNFLDFDPAHFTKNNLTLDGAEFNVLDNGWKFMSDIYRYIALQATRPDGKPVVIKKGRQVGATMMAGALDLFFTNSGLFTDPNIRVIHLFPALGQVKKFSQDKLENLIRTAKDDFITKNKLNTPNSVDNLTMKQFNTGTLWIDSLGTDGDRIRGMTVDVGIFDECFPYDQHIETSDGKVKIGELFRRFEAGEELPMARTFNESIEKFEYKKIKKAWNRGSKGLVKITAGKWRIKCTGNHRFLTSRGWVPAEELLSGDLLKSRKEGAQRSRALNDDQRQLVLGSFLGDGHLDRTCDKGHRLMVNHGEAQEEYCKWKSKIINANVTRIEKNGFSQKPAIRFSSKMFCMNLDLPKTKSTCPQEVLDELDERGLAIWFMDDGSVNARWKSSAAGTLHTSSFDEDSQKRIVKKLNSMGIKCHYSKYFSKQRNKHYFYVLINKDGFKSLSELISPYVHPSMSHKLLKPFAGETYSWNQDFKEYSWTIVNNVTPVEKKEVVYDIEVEDNHNFILSSRKGSSGTGGPIVHNCQEMLPHAIGNATKILTAAKYGPVGQGVQVYFGTPKSKNSHFATIWGTSDQRYYHLGCINCKKTYPFYLPDDNRWQSIWLYENIVQCPLCGTKQKKIEAIELGKWVSTRPFEESDFVGFHINQLYIPYFTKENIEKLMPENNPAQTERIWKNEVIGEFYSGAGSPLTKAEVYNLCRDPDRYFAKSISSKEKTVYLGSDWGGKDDDPNSRGGQSFSCVVVLSASPDGILSIEHAHKLKKNTFDFKKDTIKEMYRRFGVTRGVSDWFFGQDVVSDLQLVYGDRFLGAQGSGSLAKPVKYREDELIISYNKDLLIDELIELFRKGKVRFPWKSYEHMEWLIDHCTSMETKIRTSGGQPIKTYVKGNSPNDGFMALIYAYMAYKFDLTKGFSMRPGLDKRLEYPRPVIANIKRRI